jgi:hypothetical protein
LKEVTNTIRGNSDEMPHMPNIQYNLYLRFFLGAMDLNTELRKVLTEDNVTLRILTYDH